MKTLRDSSVVKAEEGIEEIWNGEERRDCPRKVAGLFLRARVTIAKAFTRAEVYLLGGGSCVYACAECCSIVHRTTSDIPKNSVLCMSCKSEVFLKRLRKCEYPYGYQGYGYQGQ
jgi:hypothetical protein